MAYGYKKNYGKKYGKKNYGKKYGKKGRHGTKTVIYKTRW